MQVSNLDEGIASELAAIRAADDDWYAAVLTGFSKDDILDAAAAIEATGKKMLLAVTSDADVLSSAYTLGGTDIGSVLKTAGYTRTRLFFSREPGKYPNAAEAANLRFDPGTATWSFKTLTGIDPEGYTTTEYNNLVSKNVNSYSQVAGYNVTSNNGVQSSGLATDIQVFADFLEARVAEAVFTVLATLPKVPYDDRGFSALKGAVLGVLKRQESQSASPLIPGSSFATVPNRADVDPADAAARLLNKIDFGGVLSGAVHKVRLRGVLSL